MVPSSESKNIFLEFLLEEQWGVFGPPALASSKNDADLKAAKDKFLGRLFLMGADRRRFANLLDALCHRLGEKGYQNLAF